ncbi:ADP-ribosylglycohydrolase [Pholiota conissans]|uniref:ADP-ribosylhydrolase ARH3 n=1 Tax=Pholiota conissans TaxID=109636 RepID=A0A9P5ZGI5_9AGAR|nr:ADP-ribosylglycohydrolase [Pholiota conissans]
MSFFKKKKFGKDKKSEGGSSSSHTPGFAPGVLHNQLPTPSSVATKIRLSLMGTAIVDALGAPVEFKPRFSFPFLSTMEPNDNFHLPAGVWTDDTSMMLCLAKSLATWHYTDDAPYLGGFDEADQMRLYTRWKKEGYLSAIGRCFDIGNTISRSLAIYSRHEDRVEEALHLIRSELSDESTSSGNGSLMRVLPIGLTYWRDEARLKEYGRRSSETTHPAALPCEVCQFWCCLIALVLEKATQPELRLPDSTEPPFSKLTLLDYISRYPYVSHHLNVALTLPYALPPRPEGEAEREEYYSRHHPLLRLITETQAEPLPRGSKFPYHIPSEGSVKSTGYVLHTLIAALYCFFTTKTFEEGALMAVNMGNDADTVGAVYAGLAGVWYAGSEGRPEAEGVFWTKRVREWRKATVNLNIVESVAEGLVEWETKLAH